MRRAILVLLLGIWATAAAGAGDRLGPSQSEPVDIGGRVLEDLAPLGTNGGEDVGVPNVTVYAYLDANGNGVLDAGDPESASAITGSDGTFTLSVLPPEGGATFFVVVDSRTVGTTRGLNEGFVPEHIWAEQTYQTEYVNGGWVTVKKFGGRDPGVSDDVANGIYEHQVAVDTNLYDSTSIEFGFSFQVIVSTRDVDEDGTSGTGRSAQGTLRQFIENARAISGPDRSYFILDHGGPYSREIQVDPRLWTNCGGSYNRAAHPSYGITDDGTHLDGRILDWDLDPTGDVVLLDSRDLPDDAMVFLLAADSCTVEHLELMGNRSVSPDTPNRGIRLSGANHNLIRDLLIYDFHLGIELYWNSHRNTIFRVEAFNNNHSGIYFQDYWARSSYNEIRECHLHDNDINGIGLAWDNDYSTIADNLVEGNGYAGIYVGYACDHNLVQGNVVRGNAVSGILLASWPGYPPPQHNEVVDNLVQGNGGATVGPWGPVEYGSGVGLYNADNNVVRANRILDNRSPDVAVYGVAINAGSTGNTVEGNEIAGNGVGVAVVDDGSYGNVFSRNSIYRNEGLGIDLGDDGVSTNDGVLGSPNRGVDYPVFTRAEFRPDGTLYLEGYIGPEGEGGSPAFSGAMVEVFLVTNGLAGDDLRGNDHAGKTYGEGWIYLGSLEADANGEFAGTLSPAGLPMGPTLLLSGTTTLAGAGTSEFGVVRNACHPLDLNGDCSLSIGDVRIVYLMARGCVTPDPAADMDGDGDVDMDDAEQYAEILLGGG